MNAIGFPTANLDDAVLSPSPTRSWLNRLVRSQRIHIHLGTPTEVLQDETGGLALVLQVLPDVSLTAPYRRFCVVIFRFSGKGDTERAIMPSTRRGVNSRHPRERFTLVESRVRIVGWVAAEPISHTAGRTDSAFCQPRRCQPVCQGCQVSSAAAVPSRRRTGV